jgi:hypothetical protein
MIAYLPIFSGIGARRCGAFARFCRVVFKEVLALIFEVRIVA